MLATASLHFAGKFQLCVGSDCQTPQLRKQCHVFTIRRTSGRGPATHWQGTANAYTLVQPLRIGRSIRIHIHIHQQTATFLESVDNFPGTSN